QSAVYAVPGGQCPHRILRLEPQLAVPREIPFAPTALKRLNLGVAEVHCRRRSRSTSRFCLAHDESSDCRCFLLLRVLELLVERDEVTVHGSLRALLACGVREARILNEEFLRLTGS